MNQSELNYEYLYYNQKCSLYTSSKGFAVFLNISTSERTTSTHVESEYILLLWHPQNEPIKGGNTFSGHQIQLSGAEVHSSVQPSIDLQVSLDFLHHVLVHLFQIPEWFGCQVLSLSHQRLLWLLNQIGFLVIFSKLSLSQQDFL